MEEKIRLMFLTHRSFPHIGGLEVHVHEISNFLSRNYPDEIEILHLSTDINKEDIIKYNENYSLKRIKAKYLDGEIWPILTPGVKKRILSSINEFSPSIIHTHNRFVPTTRFVLSKSNQINIPIIHTEHSSTMDYSKNRVINSIIKFFDNKYIKRNTMNAAVITAVSLPGAKLLENNWNIKNVSVTENFVSPKDIPQKREISDKSSIVFVGRLAPVKGYSELFELIQSPKNAHKLPVTIIGSGPGNKSAEELQKNIKNVVYLGALSHKETLEEMSKHNIQVNLSFSEGLATTVMEGMILGQTIIATDIIPNKILLEKYPGSVFVPINPDIDTWNKAVAKAIDLSNSNYSTEGIKIAPTVDKTASKYIKLYKEFSNK